MFENLKKNMCEMFGHSFDPLDLLAFKVKSEHKEINTESLTAHCQHCGAEFKCTVDTWKAIQPPTIQELVGRIRKSGRN